MLISHITLLTGDCVTHRLDTLDPSAVQQCSGLLPSGGPVPAFPAFRVEIHGPVFSIWRGQDPIVLCGIGSGHDRVWDELTELHDKLAPGTPAPNPHKGAWLGAVILPGMVHLTRADIAWLADFELRNSKCKSKYPLMTNTDPNLQGALRRIVAAARASQLNMLRDDDPVNQWFCRGRRSAFMQCAHDVKLAFDPAYFARRQALLGRRIQHHTPRP